MPGKITKYELDTHLPVVSTLLQAGTRVNHRLQASSVPLIVAIKHDQQCQLS